MLRFDATFLPRMDLALRVKPYVFSRPNSPNLFVRWMVPKAARAVVGRAEFTKSLGVSCKKEAVDLARPILLQWKAEVAAAIGGSAYGNSLLPLTVPSATDIENAAISIGYDIAGERAVSLVKRKAALGAVAYEEWLLEMEERHREAVRLYHAGDLTYWKSKGRHHAIKRGWNMPDESDSFRAFSIAIAQAGIDTLAKTKALISGTADQFVPSMPLRQAIQRRDARAAKGETMMELFELYAARRLAEGHKRADTVAQDRKVVELFSAFIGPDRSLRLVSAVEVREWRDTIAALPPAYRKHKAFAGLSIRDAAAKAKSNQMTGLSQTTVNKYLSTVSPLFAWARKDGYVDSNPCDGLYYDIKKGKNRRPSYSMDQISRIIASPLFNGFDSDGKEYREGESQCRDWRYWIPLICLFTGARIGEISQMRIDDIKREDRLDYFMIRHDEVEGQTTKSGYSRPAVIHSRLREMGFQKFIETQRKRALADGSTRIFPELEPDVRGQLGWYPSRFWRTYLTRIGLKNGKDGFGAHSFRHTMADQLRLVGFLDNEIAIVLGHKNGGVTAGYGQVRQGTIQRMSDMVEKVKFDGVDFTKLSVV